MAAEIISKEESKSPGIDLKLILIGLGIFAIAIGITYFLMRSLISPLVPESNRFSSELNGSLVEIGEFTTNIGSTGNRYVKVAVAINVEAEQVEKVSNYMPIIKDTILSVLSQQDISQMGASNDALKETLREEINSKLGSNIVNSVYFTNFILQ